ncbi:MAG: hypothetical protein IJX85_06150 [Lachnospiraceae bacterium]|nr:hypothetical protein [Lachnospiraceae bacterium]
MSGNSNVQSLKNIKRIKKAKTKEDSVNALWTKENFGWFALGSKFKPFAYVKCFFRYVRYSKQRVERGYCDMDRWRMHEYLRSLMLEMLQDHRGNRLGSPSRLGKDYVDERGILVNETCHSEWDKVLDHMIFLLKEMDEDSCSKKNPYEEEHLEAHKEFEEKYGFLGVNLRTPEEIESDNKSGYTTMHTMRDAPEYAEIEKRYMEEDMKLSEYRNQCKDEFFDMMKEHFMDLWD